ncbi:MAG: cation transporter [Chloroflexi bacterium]|nr:cation diffusion facilitator family transporter [Anaerolineaceae bacterium]NMB87026.1 cation transporter [Chloroflexota bacterium]
MRWIRNYTPRPDQDRLYHKALAITIVGNLVLAISKGLVAYYSGSAALYADAANSASDVLYSLLMVLGLWMAQRPPDLSHPQGHSRFEPLVGLAVSFSMGFAGYEAVHTAIERFQTGGIVVAPLLPTLVLLSSAAVKGGMFVYIRRLSQVLNSPTLATTAQDNLSDVLTSIAAVAGVYGSHLIHPLADPVAGLLVAAWIFRAAARAAIENLGFLTGAGASPELRQQIVTMAASVPGVQHVHHMMSEYVGPQLVVDLHINVDGQMTLNEAHAISDSVAEKLQELPEVDRAYVHIEPDGWID